MFHPLNASEDANIEFGDSAYMLPSEVLRTAVQPFNISSNIYVNCTDKLSYDEFYVYLHFAEIQKLPRGHERIINVTFDDINSPAEIITLEYLKPVTLSPKKPIKGYATFTISAAAESGAPPILNAYEVYILNPQPNSLTDEADGNYALIILIILLFQVQVHFVMECKYTISTGYLICLSFERMVPNPCIFTHKLLLIFIYFFHPLKFVKSQESINAFQFKMQLKQS